MAPTPPPITESPVGCRPQTTHTESCTPLSTAPNSVHIHTLNRHPLPLLSLPVLANNPFIFTLARISTPYHTFSLLLPLPLLFSYSLTTLATSATETLRPPSAISCPRLGTTVPPCPSSSRPRRLGLVAARTYVYPRPSQDRHSHLTWVL